MIYRLGEMEVDTPKFYRAVSEVVEGKKSASSFRTLTNYSLQSELGEAGYIGAVRHTIKEVVNNQTRKRDLFFFGVIEGRSCFFTDSQMQMQEIDAEFHRRQCKD